MLGQICPNMAQIELLHWFQMTIVYELKIFILICRCSSRVIVGHAVKCGAGELVECLQFVETVVPVHKSNLGTLLYL